MSKKIIEIEKNQKAFFNTHKTFEILFRIEALKKLKLTIRKYEPEIIKALRVDPGKNEFEAITNEIGLTQKELSTHIKYSKKWASPKRVSLLSFYFLQKVL